MFNFFYGFFNFYSKREMILTGFGLLLGALGGYLYWKYIGCASGTCPITANKYIMIVYGIMAGGLLFSTFASRSSMLTPTALKTDTFNEAMESGTYTLIDLRPKSEFNKAHFGKATHFTEYATDFSSLTQSFSEGSNLLFYCSDGKTAEKVGLLFKRKGFRYVYYLDGGTKVAENPIS